MIQKLESAGLGYHVTADETEDKLGISLVKSIREEEIESWFLF